MLVAASAPHLVVVGAGVGGLTAAALLLKVGWRVTVLEAQAYAGGCAGSFPYQGYRFDAGATLAGGFQEGGPHARLAEDLGLSWDLLPVDPAWVVHLPGGPPVRQWADAAAWEAEHRAAFPGAEGFWTLQRRLADVSWDLSRGDLPWPPETGREFLDLTASLRPRHAAALPYVLRRMGGLLPPGDDRLRTFVDAGLLIAAQCSAAEAGALYGAAALDLPRRGVATPRGGMGGIAATLVAWIRAQGGQVLFKHTVERLELAGGRVRGVVAREGRRGTRRMACDALVANQTPWSLLKLLGEDAPPALRRRTQGLPPTWGAFMLYLGLDAAALPPGAAEHHQVVMDLGRPLGEGNSVFLSVSPAADAARAPAGMRAANLSTHTAVAPWWRLRQLPDGGAAYEARRQRYQEAMLAAAERALPGLRGAVRLQLPATPVTYAHWTARADGMVGGFPQGDLWRARGPRAGLGRQLANLWQVGDSVFPGQSTAGVTLGGMRVARAVLAGWRRG